MGGLVAHHRDHAYRRGLAVSSATLLVLCPILTLRWGIIGAAIAAALSQVVNLILFMVDARDLVHPEYIKTLGVPVLMAAIPVLLGMIIHLGFWTSVTAIVLIYMGAVIWRRPVLYPVLK